MGIRHVKTQQDIYKMNRDTLANLIDHTNLKSYAVTGDIDLLCTEAKEYGFASVCVHGYWVDYIKENYPSIKIAQVLNFPDGLSTSHTDTLSRVNSSADEYDMVLNISKIKEKEYLEVKDELQRVKAYVGNKILKVIVESAVLNTEELLSATGIVADSGADFIKTSTGMITQPDTHLIDQVHTIHNFIKLHQLPIEIKASGGIKSLDLVKILIGEGVTRLGTSNSVKILMELEARTR